MSDQGYGKFGSLEWHENSILCLLTVDDIQDYMFRLTGRMFIPLADLDNTKTKAIGLLNGYSGASH